ncbi:MAG: permease-like cell division protein FtsX [Clostridiales bacterium]|nr:permease-like cell division protein FtsX [Clostridiales bacterium]
MKLSSFRYLIPEAAASMKRNVLTTFVAVATVAIALFFCAAFWLLGQNLDANVAVLESGVELVVNLDRDVAYPQVESLKEQIAGLEGAASVTVISKEEALEKMSRRFGDLFGILDENPLPYGFSVFPETPEYLASLQEQIAALEGVYSVRGGDEEAVERLLAFTAAMRKAGLVVMCLLGLTALALISMSVRVAVYARRKEVMVMKWSGASNWFIRWPFLLEGVFVGVLGAVLALAGCLCFYVLAGKLLQADLAFVLFLSVGQVWLPVTVLTLAAGAVIGGVGSAISVGRFLDV